MIGLIFRAAAHRADEDGRDIAHFDELLAKLKSEYCIDPERIFVNGQSYGGLMTNAVGCLRGDVVRAIAVTVPGMPAQCMNYQGCDPGHPVIGCPHVDDSGHQHPSFGRVAVREFLASF